MRRLIGTGLILLTQALAGCGDGNAPGLVPVSGKITLKGEPLAGAIVAFIPVGTTRGSGATGRTKADGTYELTENHGGKGAAPGEYKVAVSRRLMPDGTPLAGGDGSPPIESPARESLPLKFSDPGQTVLKATVPAGGGTINFAL